MSDTGPILHLDEAKASNLLGLAGEVHIPQAVDAELFHHQASWASDKPVWVRVTALHPPYDKEAETWQQAGLLDAGEAEAIALARQLHAKWLLTNDAPARLLDQSLGLEVHGSLGVVLWADSRAD